MRTLLRMLKAKAPPCAMPVGGGPPIPMALEDAKSAKDVGAWLSKKHPGMEVDFAEANLAASQAVARQISKILDDIPALQGQLAAVRVGRVPGRAYAQYDYNKRAIVFNRATMGRSEFMLKAEIRESGRLGFLINVPKGMEHEYVASHEVGHALTTVLQKNPATRRQALELLTGRPAMGLSEYAATDKWESVAEAFAQMRLVPAERWASYTKNLASMVGRL